MTNTYTSNSSESFIQSLKAVTADTAREFLLEHGYTASSFEIPEYYAPSKLDSINLRPIAWLDANGKKNEMPKITQPLEFLTPKGFLGWRSFSMLHPYIYIHVVNEMTEPSAWKTLQDILCTETLVSSYSTPGFVVKEDEVTKKQAIDRWVLMAEKDLVKDCVGYSFLTVTDIKNFYPSIYTHSISWAIEGKENIRNGNRQNYTLLGNKLDKLFQNSRDGQTNGIPVGSMVSDIIAEVILKRVDEILSEWIEEEDLEDSVLLTRYRDDYRILSKAEEDGRMVLKELGRILNSEYNLTLNEEKTKIFSDILEGTIRDWSSEINEDFLLRQVKYEEMDDTVTFYYLNDILLKIYKIQKKYPNGRPSVTLLSKLITHLDSEDVTFELDESGVHTLVSILRKLSLVREEVSAQVFMLLDILFGKLSDEIKNSLIEEILETIRDSKDYDYQIVWLYRLCLAHNPDTCKTIDTDSSQLLQVLTDDYVNGTKTDIEIFPEIDGLDASDTTELKKFSLVSHGILADSPNKAIDKESLRSFSYRHK